MAASAKTRKIDDCTLDGEWTVVLPRRGKKRRKLTKVEINTEEKEEPWAPADLQTDQVRESALMQKMQKCISKIQNSQFYQTFLDQIQTPPVLDYFHRVLSSELKMQMVIYGIGSIDSYEPPRLQLGLAILIKRHFSWIGDIEVFDPVLSATESRVLEALGCSVLSTNEHGRRQVLKPTLFFMPHCEAELYNNLLQANWKLNQLNNMVLFGNSFEEYEHISEFKSSPVVDSVGHIVSVRRFTSEFKIKTISDDYYNAFHDSSWHFFSPALETELQYINS